MVSYHGKHLMTTIESVALRRTRGMRDLLPSSMRAFRRVEDAFRSAASHWGYSEVRTPTLESYSLFTAAGALTPQMLSRVYSFLDWDGWSGERVVLRPDSTVPVARAAAEADLPMPARLFYVQNRFRFEEGDADREDWQCGIEYLEAPPLLGELETALIACETLEALGMAPVVHLSHVGVAQALLEAAGPADRDVHDAVVAQGLEALRPLVADNARLTAVLEAALQPAANEILIENVSALAEGLHPKLDEALQDLRSVAAGLRESGRSIVLELGMPSDFEYYTGVVFEFESEGSMWGRGGRYALPAPIRQDTACGLALEAGALAARLAEAGTEPVLVAVVPAAPADLSRAIAVARALHRSGVEAALEPDGATTAVKVRVSGDVLEAVSGGKTKQVSGIEDVVALVLQQK